MNFPLITDGYLYAAAILAVLLLMDVLGMAAFRKNFDMVLLKFLVPCGLVGTGA